MITQLRIERENQGIRAWRLAQLADVPAYLLSLYETGRKRVPADHRHRLAEQLKLKVEQVFPEEQYAQDRS